MRCPNHVLGERLRLGIIALGIGLPSFILGVVVVRIWFFQIDWMNRLFDTAGFLVVVAMAIVAIVTFVLLTVAFDIAFTVMHSGYREHFRNEWDA